MPSIEEQYLRQAVEKNCLLLNLDIFESESKMATITNTEKMDENFVKIYSKVNFFNNLNKLTQ